MLLAVDVGNTQTVLGLYDGEELVEHWRVATESERTGDEIAALVVRLLELRDLGFEEVNGVALSSTVTSPDVQVSTRGIMRVGRFLSQTQTSSIFNWKNGYDGWGTYCMSSLLHRYV